MQILKRIFSSETSGGRVARTILQAFVAVTGGFVAILSVPEIYDWFSELPFLIQIGGISVLVGVVSAAQNYGKELWDKVKDW